MPAFVESHAVYAFASSSRYTGNGMRGRLLKTNATPIAISIRHPFTVVGRASARHWRLVSFDERSVLRAGHFVFAEGRGCGIVTPWRGISNGCASASPSIEPCSEVTRRHHFHERADAAVPETLRRPPSALNWIPLDAPESGRYAPIARINAASAP